MTTTFSTLPIVSLAPLSDPHTTPEALKALSTRLDDVFKTTGFAYLVDLPLTYTHDDVFGLCDRFFGTGTGGEGEEGVGEKEKERLLKKTFRAENGNTYRGYFPVQPNSLDNYKEGFEMGSPLPISPLPTTFPAKFNLAEPNIWPSPASSSMEEDGVTFQAAMETLHTELQTLSANLLSLLAIGLGQHATYFDHYLKDSLSTLRLIHYPPPPASSVSSSPTSSSTTPEEEGKEAVELICTPHTDSGILTILHQDPTGGLEVRNAAGEWIPAPYVPGSVVVNIGDLMSMVSGGRWVATVHRVRRTSTSTAHQDKKGRYSVPFFFEPGAECVVRPVLGSAVSGEKAKEGVIYGEHLLKKMSGWIEFQDVVVDEQKAIDGIDGGKLVAVAAF